MEFELFDGLSPAERRDLVAACTPRKFRRRDIVCHEGDPGDCLHLITSGKLIVRVTTPLGHTATLTILGQGEMFGEQAILSPDARRTATIVAVTDAETLTLSRERLERLRTDHPQVERFLTVSLAAQVRRLSAAVLEALYLPVETRVLRRLSHLARVYGDPGRAAQIRLTQEDLASMAGTTRATANKVLRELEDAGVVRLSRGSVTVLDRMALERKAN
ncbi:Crp/Fnr family transcriptional regulator [Nocardia otitidiscaviarum]|uniref:Crp/Fnr family transcriptional regulator n=1 Tax=Nocardia otitidiscaviarum TaxID=1823 RepID=UPI0004A6D000|nr:Crp/Fnr family transcriptional regulator [Nocardia otitidiscaviarum]MBF6136037.1 Crp/Fnr family transcriptional regulator [Nocardia otitidiscaviarum]MBF6483794.1 Crp/Fnr family transcriptional regulator [Nocardia otitidiscaviarum]